MNTDFFKACKNAGLFPSITQNYELNKFALNSLLNKEDWLTNKSFIYSVTQYSDNKKSECLIDIIFFTLLSFEYCSRVGYSEVFQNNKIIGEKLNFFITNLNENDKKILLEKEYFLMNKTITFEKYLLENCSIKSKDGYKNYISLLFNLNLKDKIDYKIVIEKIFDDKNLDLLNFLYEKDINENFLYDGVNSFGYLLNELKKINYPFGETLPLVEKMLLSYEIKSKDSLENIKKFKL